MNNKAEAFTDTASPPGEALGASERDPSAPPVEVADAVEQVPPATPKRRRLDSARLLNFLAETVAEDLHAARKDRLPSYVAIGHELKKTRERFPSTKLYRQHLAENMPAVAAFPPSLLSNCLWVVRNEAEILEVFGWNSIDQSPWQSPTTIRAQYRKRRKEQSAAKDD